MIKTLQESSEKLAELVEAASRGEDVLITVDGKVKARLTRARDELPHKLSKEELERWMEELREGRERSATGRQSISTQQILDEIREDRF